MRQISDGCADFGFFSDSASSLLSDIIGQTDNITLSISQSTGSNVIDTIVAFKAAVCENRNISFEYVLDVLPELKVDYADISSVISNLIDNAIEAAERSDDPNIMLKIYAHGSYIDIFVKNTYNGKINIDERELKNSRTVSVIISYFINDVIDNSIKAIASYSDEDFEENNHSIDRPLVKFSDEASMLCKYLETIISNKVINSPEVTLFDNNASTIVSGLFKAYYNNPRLLHKGTQRRIYIDTRKITQNVIDFEYGNHDIIREEIELITKTDLNTLDDAKKEEYKGKRKILVRNICDFIAGMTDTYALNEFRKIEKQL